MFGFPYIMYKCDSIENVLEACLIAVSSWGLLGGSVRFSRKFQSLGPLLDFATSIILAATLTASLKGFIKPQSALYLFATVSAGFGFLILLLPSIYIKNQDALPDETSKRRTRYLAADLIGMSTLAWNALDSSLPISHVALRSALAFLYVASPISTYHALIKKSQIAMFDAIVCDLGLLLILVASPTVLQPTQI
mmetsp:Transcript_14351/g.19185  ORF Transcript_14351/g.19185 Transcript_14351/m.19185 type:complete len:194 (+) Transcript_14351:332-913(+)